MSERRAGAVLGQPRSTQRYALQPDEEAQPLVQQMLALVREQPRYGHRRITALLKRAGGHVNRKRV